MCLVSGLSGAYRALEEAIKGFDLSSELYGNSLQASEEGNTVLFVFKITLYLVC